jgi:glutathione S-transferase
MSAFVALRIKGLVFDLTPLDLATGQNSAAAYSSASLTNRVPTLVNGALSRQHRTLSASA